ncbi:uncharacterized protein [Asterias amurensis]|uniref:uncharacterized protein isoform X2 n=1 Tax=Asterias amurensis TaxID=7602 RepID=UPI003AB51EB8
MRTSRCLLTMDPDTDEEWIELEIQRQLDAISISDNELVQTDGLQEDISEASNKLNGIDDLSLNDYNEDDNVPKSVKEYLDKVIHRADGLQRDLDECEHLLSQTAHGEGNDEFYYQSDEMKEIAFIVGEDPEELRERVLAEVEDEEQIEAVGFEESTMTHIPQQDFDPIEKVRAAQLEQEALLQLQQLHHKLKQRDLDMNREIEERVQQDKIRHKAKNLNREKKQKQHNDELHEMELNRQIANARADKELLLEAKETQDNLEKQQADIEEFARRTEEEREEFEQHLATVRQRQQLQRLHATIKIQAAFRSYRVRTKYQFRLNRLREERLQRKLQNRQMEIISLRRAEEQKKKKEKAEKKQKQDERRKMEKLQEEERDRKERLEQDKREQEQKRRVLLEKKKLEEEQKQKEEDSRQQQYLHDRTQEILSKIQKEKAIVTKEVVSTTVDNKTHPPLQEVFLTSKQTTVEQSLTSHTSIQEHHIVTSNDSILQQEHSTTTGSSEDAILMMPNNISNENLSQVSSNKQPDDKQLLLDSVQQKGEPTVLNQPEMTDNYPQEKEGPTTAMNQPEMTDNYLQEKEGPPTAMKQPEMTDNYLQEKEGPPSAMKQPEMTDNYPQEKEGPTTAMKQPEMTDNYLQEKEGPPTAMKQPEMTDNYPQRRKEPNVAKQSEHSTADSVLFKASHLQTATPSSQYDVTESVNPSCNTIVKHPQTVSDASQIKTRDIKVNGLVSSASLDIQPSKVNTSHNEIVQNGNEDSQSNSLDIESRWSQWKQNCVSHSSLMSSMKYDEARKVLRKSHGLKKFPDLTVAQLLSSSQPKTPLAQVTTIILHDVSGCSLTSLSQCTNLQCLEMTHCGVTHLHGLQEHHHIAYINLQHNKVENVCCRDMTKLTQLLLGDNQLTSVHGLEGCNQLYYVQLSHNSITRTDGLKCLSSLTHLDLGHNQLVSIKGLGNLVCLQDLNLSHNHLSAVQELETCCLLQRLNIQSNCLVEMPPVDNLVLLRELQLNDNSISSVAILSDAWLPLLQHLHLAQNGLVNVADVKFCLMLKTLDMSNNCITDIDTVLSGLNRCIHLEDLCLEGNPVTQDDQYRGQVLKRLPWLQTLDTEVIAVHSPLQPCRNAYEIMCRSQLQAQDQLHTLYQKSHDGDLSRNLVERCSIMSSYMKCSLTQALQHRRMQESGNMLDSRDVISSFNECVAANTPSSVNVHLHQSGVTPVHQSPVTNNDLILRDDHHETDTQLQLQRKAAVRIQSRWRGFIVRRDIDKHTTLWMAASHIQALWRGYRVRKRLAVARQAARYNEEDDMLYDEIDPMSWDLAQAKMDIEWLPSEMPSIPRIHPLVPDTHSVPKLAPEPPSARQAWCASPDTRPTLVSKPPIPPIHTLNDTPRSNKSHKQDQITQEWGFKDSTTAELMMKRAKKLTKGAKSHRKKTKDPLERYQIMKKGQESSRVVVPPKKRIERQEFFQARDHELRRITTEETQDKEHKHARTFEWVHTTAGINIENGRQSNSEPNLPVMSPDVLQGRVQLMGSPLLELQSVDGASSISSIPHRPRSHSLSSQQGFEQVRFPAIKTNSAPSGRSRGPVIEGNNRIPQRRTSRNNTKV